MAKQPTYAVLRGLLGKRADDPAVADALAGAGTVKVSKTAIVAKQAGFEFALSQPVGGKRSAKKLLSTLFLYPAFGELPEGFAFTTRDALLAKLPAPALTWKIGPGKVPASTPSAEVSHDRWTRDGVEVAASYREGAVRHISISLPEDATGGGRLATHPLHFETRPADAPPGAELVGMALLVAWAAERFGLPDKHATGKLGAQLAKRAITPRMFLEGACDGTLTTLDVHPKARDFLKVYTNNMHRSDEGARAPTKSAIGELLGLPDGDTCSYSKDFVGTFARAVDNPFYVPDSWEAVDRIAPVIDARLADFEATAFMKPPELAPYQHAAALRDARAVAPARATLERPAIDATLGEELVALIDKPLTDKHVKAVLGRAGLPVGKRIDQQANPALGVAYMGTKIEIAGKKVLGVDAVWFFADKQRRYIRGIGAEVEFVGFPGALPHGLALGQSRAEVAARLGAPARSGDDHDSFTLAPDRVVGCSYEADKLVMAHFGKPVSW